MLRINRQMLQIHSHKKWVSLHNINFICIETNVNSISTIPIDTSYLQKHYVDNVTLLTLCICRLLHYLQHLMLINVKLDIKNTFEGCRPHWSC